MVKIPFELQIIAFLLLFAAQQAISQNVVPVERDIILDNSAAVIEIENDSIDTLNLSGDSTVVKSDSIKKRNTLNAPVKMNAKDSVIIDLENKKFLYLYGKSSVKHEAMNLDGEIIEMNADKSEIHARFGVDSAGVKFGYPVFKSGEQETEMEKLWYNFNTEKMFTNNVITQQGEGYIKAQAAKRMPDETFHLHNGIYTTCDDPECPHYHIVITKAKSRPGKSTVTGPVYLVLEGVPLPFIGLPFAYIPATSNYSSGILMPTWGTEMARGYSLTNGGYYFAFNDHVDLELRGEIYTKGSWGLSANSRYKKIYKYSGNFIASYLVTKIGDSDTKHLPNSDYSVSRDIKVAWSHQQDAKANPFGTFSANLNFSTSSYNRNNFGSSTLSQMTENTKASSVSYSYRSPSPNLPLSVNASASINQRSRDSTISVSLPDMTISLSNIYPFKRKEQIGPQLWYEKIYMSYTGTIRSSINNVKEKDFFNQNYIKDWKNGMKHNIPVSASFNLLRYINISTSFNYSENWYSNRYDYGYDYAAKRVVPIDTIDGFFRTYSYNTSVSMNTKWYGTFKPLPFLSHLFGDWVKKTEIRHVVTPTVSFSGAPDFSNPSWGMFKDVHYFDNTQLDPHRIQRISLYQNHLFGGPSAGRTGAINFTLDNNLEAKIPVSADSTRKVSIIDNLGLGTSYNFLADSMNWANINASIRLKIFKTNLSFSGQFDAYKYNENGVHINEHRWKTGRGIGRLGRFMGTSTSYSYTFNNDTFKKLFGKKDNDSGDSGDNGSQNNEGDNDENAENQEATRPSRPSLSGVKKSEGDFDSNGYLIFDIPWSFTLNYSIGVAYDRQKFNKETREYPYRINQTMGFNGNFSPTKAWDINFGGSYDFEFKKVVNMHCGITRKLHCWNMSASLVPIGPYKNYSVTIQINASMLQDLKYRQSSSPYDALNWGR